MDHVICLQYFNDVCLLACNEYIRVIKIKLLKFNIPEILPSLLNKTKTTTIRKAWQLDVTNGENVQPLDVQVIPKPCKFEVGKVYEVVYFDEESAVGMKDSKTGKRLPDKRLGKVKILSKEKIDILENSSGYRLMTNSLPSPGSKKGEKGLVDWHWCKKCKTPEIELFSMREGFKDVETMFKALSNYAGDLTEPKPFWLITFKWIK